MCIARGPGRVPAPDCGAPASPSDFTAGLIRPLAAQADKPKIAASWRATALPQIAAFHNVEGRTALQGRYVNLYIAEAGIEAILVA